MKYRLLFIVGACLVVVAVVGNILLYRHKSRFNYELWQVLSDGDPGKVDALIRNGADVNCRKPAGMSYSGGQGGMQVWSHPSDRPLHLAVRFVLTQNEYEVVEVLLKAGARPNAVNESGWTALHVVGRTGLHAQPEVVQLLLDHGAEVNVADGEGAMPLHYFAWHGATDIVELLVEHGATATLIDQILMGQTDKAIEQLEADPSLVTRPGVQGLQPIHAAAKRTDRRLVEYLVDHGADVNATSTDGATPLVLVLTDYRGNTENVPLLEYLLDKGADISISSTTYGTPLAVAIANASREDPACALLLIERGADLSDNTPSSESALSVAIRFSKWPVVQAIFARADMENVWPDVGLDRALFSACQHRAIEPEIVETLLAHGANPNLRPSGDGWTPLHHVAMREDMRDGAAIAEVLIEHGANVNARDREGRTPLNFANGNPAVKAVLLKHGAKR